MKTNKLQMINLEENNNLKYFIIQNIKDIDLSKINKEIKSEIGEYLTNILFK